MSDIPPPPAYPPPPPPSSPPPGPPHTEPTLLASSGPEPPKPSRAPVIALAAIGVAIVVALAVAVPMLVTDEPSVPSDLNAVRSYDDLKVDHTPDDVDYPQSPPVGGPHAPVWLDCGVYDEPVREENAVHDLEHGTVWISYNPDLDADDVAELADQLPQNGIMAPYPGLTVPVVVTVWGRQLELAGADDARLALFIRTYGGGETAPEASVTCAGGVRDPDGESGDDGGPGTDI